MEIILEESSQQTGDNLADLMNIQLAYFLEGV